MRGTCPNVEESRSMTANGQRRIRSPRRFSWMKELKKRARTQSWEDVLDCLVDMEASRMSPTTRMYNLALMSCASAAAWAMALWLLRCSPEPQDIISRNMVLRACCKASQWPRSIQLLGQFQPDATSLSTVAAALEDWELAVALLHDARGQVIQPNIVVYGAAAGRARGHWPAATALLAAAAQQGIGISKIAQSAVMSSHEAAGRWESTLLMLEGARRTHLEPGVVEFSSGVSASSRSWPLALEVLSEAKACGIQLDAVANNAAITAAGRGSCWPLALETLEQASAQGARTVRSFRAALAAIGSGGWQGALRLLSSMRQRAVTPDLECFNEVLLACASAGAWEVCTSTLQVMRASRCPPDLRAFGCSARSCPDPECYPVEP
eukprot:s148_g32.t1